MSESGRDSAAEVQVKTEDQNQDHGLGHDHGHDHDHGDFQARPLGPDPNQEPPKPNVFTRALNGLRYQGSKAFVHTRYSKLGNKVVMEYLDTTSMIAGRYNGQRTYVGQLLLAFVNMTFELRDALYEFVFSLNDFLVLLAVFVVDQMLASAWAVFRRLPLRSLVVYGSLVFGSRCFWTVVQGLPWSRAPLPSVVYAAWATFVGFSYLDYPGHWNVSSWPWTPRAVARGARLWYKSPVFWNLAGILATAWAQYKGVTEPLFP